MIPFLVTGVSKVSWFDQLDPLFRSITWNALNELIAVTKNAVIQASYSYDPQGRRVQKVAGSTTTTWTHSKHDILRQEEATASVTSISRFVHSGGIDQPLAQEDGTTGSLAYLHSDALGSIVRHTSSTGTSISSTTYNPWGDVSSGPPAGFAFTGREGDAETGLYYYRARYYDPRLGQFISEDELGRDTGTNLYAYVSGRVTLATDPSGYAAKRPKDDVSAVWLMCCFGQRVATCRGGAPQAGGTCARKCQLEHESNHLDDAREWEKCSGPICKGKPDYYILGFGPKKDIPVATGKTWECKAYREQAKCIATRCLDKTQEEQDQFWHAVDMSMRFCPKS